MMGDATTLRCAVCDGAFMANERYATNPTEQSGPARAHLPCGDMAMFLHQVLNLKGPVSFCEVPELWKRFCLLGELTHREVSNQYEQGQRLARMIDSRFAPRGSKHSPWAQGLSFLQNASGAAHAQ